MWVQENVLDRPTVSTSTRHISFTTGRLSQRAAWRAVRGSGLYPFQLQVQGLQTSPSTVYLKGATQDCVQHSTSALW
jgi:hypothetical protein